MTSVCVVIPFFQRERGPLNRAVRSVLSQTYDSPITICVIDDGSPVNAFDEIRDIAFPKQISITVITQSNQGVARARNTGLDFAEYHDFDHIAFLDSDDEWNPEHLDNALELMRAGVEFYFDDYYQPGEAVSVFEKAGFPAPDSVTPYDAARKLYLFESDLFDLIIRNYVLGTPTVVISAARFRGIRFDADFRNAGEDHLYWLDLASTNPKVGLSSNAGAICGFGVNIWAGSKWGTDAHLRALADTLALISIVRQRYILTSAQIQHLVAERERKIKNVIFTVVHFVRRRKRISLSLLGSVIRKNPGIIFRIPECFLEIIRKHLWQR